MPTANPVSSFRIFPHVYVKGKLNSSCLQVEEAGIAKKPSSNKLWVPNSFSQTS